MRNDFEVFYHNIEKTDLSAHFSDRKNDEQENLYDDKM